MNAPDHGRELSIDHLLSDIERRSVHGGAIMFGAQGIKMATQFAAAIVLTRLLPPAVFGLIAMAMALNTFLDPLKELGLTAATMQKTDITQDQVSALFWINAAGGLLLTLLLFLAAPLIAGFYNQPSLVPVIRWLAVSFLLSGLGGQHWALLRRQMRYATVATIETGAEITAFACAVVLALGGSGYWALVVQRLMVPGLVLIGSWTMCRWRPGLPRRVAGMRELFGFGASVTGCSIFVAITRSIDQILIGWLWGPSVLGLYERTTRLLQVPITNIYAPLYAVAMPALSRIAHQPQRYRRAFIEILEKLAMLTMPAAALVIVTADWVVEFLFGPGWIESAPLIAFFALAAVYQPSLIASGLLFLTQDRPRDMFHAVMIDSAISVASILAGLPFGAIGVAGSFAVTGLVVRLPVAFWLAARQGPVILSDIYKAIIPSAFAAITVGGFGWCLHRVLDGQERPAIANLALTGCAAAIVAIAVFYAVPQSRRTMRNIGQFAQFLRRREPKVQT